MSRKRNSKCDQDQDTSPTFLEDKNDNTDLSLPKDHPSRKKVKKNSFDFGWVANCHRCGKEVFHSGILYSSRFLFEWKYRVNTCRPQLLEKCQGGMPFSTATPTEDIVDILSMFLYVISIFLTSNYLK